MEGISDEELVALIRSGQTALFETIMRRYNQRLFRVARSILGNDAEAEDVMQEAYVRAYTHLDQFEGRAKFATWLTKIAVYEALARKRDHRRTVEIDELSEVKGADMTLQSKQADPEQEALTRTLRKVLESAIDSLPSGYRSVFVLREIEGVDTTETAACLQLSEGTVKVRLHRARALLRKRIYDQAGAATVSAFQFNGARCDRVVASVMKRLALLQTS